MEESAEKTALKMRDPLNVGAQENILKKKSSSIMVSFKSMSTAFVASTYVHSLFNTRAEYTRPLSRYEKTEIRALVFYVSRLNNSCEEFVRQDIEKKMGIPDFNDMSLIEFLSVREYLRRKVQ